MKTHRALSLLAVVLSMFLIGGCGRGQDTAQTEQTPNESDRVADSTATETGYGTTTPPDNTGVNVRDRDDANPTAGDQSASEGDVALTQKIRQAIVDDDSLSTNGKNVKVITIGGVVTLRGPVKDEREKTAIAEMSERIAGAGKVNNELEVTAR